VKAQVFADLSKLVVMAENGFVDALVSSSLVGDVSEELRKARPCSVALAPENVRIERRVEEQWPHVLDEGLVPNEASRAKVIPGIDPSALSYETAICTNRWATFGIELREDPIDRKELGNFDLSGRCSIAAPWPISRRTNRLRTNRVQDDISSKLKEVRLFLDEDRFEAPLKHMA
jgi:hypothetical protein